MAVRSNTEDPMGRFSLIVCAPGRFVNDGEPSLMLLTTIITSSTTELTLPVSVTVTVKAWLVAVS